MASGQVLIAAGIGCRAGCPAADIVQAVTRSVERHGLSLGDVQALYSAERKAAESGLHAAALALGKPIFFLPQAALAAQASGALTVSDAVARHFELPSVAETAALAGADVLGPPGASVRLVAARLVAGSAACALATSGASDADASDADATAAVPRAGTEEASR